MTSVWNGAATWQDPKHDEGGRPRDARSVPVLVDSADVSLACRLFTRTLHSFTLVVALELLSGLSSIGKGPGVIIRSVSSQTWWG